MSDQLSKVVAEMREMVAMAANAGTNRVGTAVRDWADRIESATAPVGVDKECTEFVNMVGDEFGNEAGVRLRELFATLARQLAEAKAEAAELRRTDRKRTGEYRARAEQAESQLAEATRRLGGGGGSVAPNQFRQPRWAARTASCTGRTNQGAHQVSVIEKLDSVLAAANAIKIGPLGTLQITRGKSEALAMFLRDHGPAIRQDMIDARRYRLVRAMCCSAEGPSAGLASAWMIGDEKAADAVIDARLASDSEGGSDAL